jgi:diadenosine tetraphosphatase ApaH/serine/threonine PP2A family protein phosphatase
MTHSGIPPGYFDIEISRIPQEKLLFNRYDFISSEKFFFGKKIIFGHTGFFSPLYDTFKIGIDTAACYIESQPLTAFCAEGEFFIDSTGNRFLLNAIDLSCCPVIPRVKPWRQK